MFSYAGCTTLPEIKVIIVNWNTNANANAESERLESGQRNSRERDEKEDGSEVC